jgi:hypothetical protein
MNFDIIATNPFERKVKRLAKKYKSLKTDLSVIFNELEINPTVGTPLGKDCYKICMAINSKGNGKRGGARIITCVRIIKKTVFLLYIYDKEEEADISDDKLNRLINLIAELADKI